MFYTGPQLASSFLFSHCSLRVVCYTQSSTGSSVFVSALAPRDSPTLTSSSVRSWTSIDRLATPFPLPWLRPSAWRSRRLLLKITSLNFELLTTIHIFFFVCKRTEYLVLLYNTSCSCNIGSILHCDLIQLIVYILYYTLTYLCTLPNYRFIVQSFTVLFEYKVLFGCCLATIFFVGKLAAAGWMQVEVIIGGMLMMIRGSCNYYMYNSSDIF